MTVLQDFQIALFFGDLVHCIISDENFLLFILIRKKANVNHYLFRVIIDAAESLASFQAMYG
jgi:hypothetical protein